MNKKTKKAVQDIRPLGAGFIERLGEDGWTYIKTVVDIVREPILILGSDLRVMAANEPFYRTFQVDPKDTEHKILYDLGNGQWDIPALRKLLEDILPKNSFFKGFEVEHDFPIIGKKIMILNAREIHCKEDATLEPCPPIILLAMEDVTDMMAVAETLALHANRVESAFAERTTRLETHVAGLEKVINDLKKR